ncbi:FKBP-type peptidyl-prolyl cis-trans isomerase, partial [Pseudomonas aeruginosa]
GVIAGWVEALQLMNAGSKWRLHVPSELAYGGQAVGSIPPHSVLVFDVELLEIL